MTNTPVDLDAMEQWLGLEPRWEAAAQWYALIQRLRELERVRVAAANLLLEIELGHIEADFSEPLYENHAALRTALGEVQ